MPKTATTTLQRRLFAHHSEIYYLGRYPESDYPERFHQNWACLDADIGSAIKNTVYFQHLHTADREQNSRRLRRCWETAADRGQVPVFSWESLATDSLARRRATDNQRFTTAQVEHLRVLSRSPLQALRFACTPPKRRMRAFHQLRHAEGTPGANKAKATISAAWRERIFAEVSEGTRWLKSVYPLHFDGYGYTPSSP